MCPLKREQATRVSYDTLTHIDSIAEIGRKRRSWINCSDQTRCVGTVQMREESESGIRKREEMWFKNLTAEDGERERGDSSDVRWKTVPQTIGSDVDEAERIIIVVVCIQCQCQCQCRPTLDYSRLDYDSPQAARYHWGRLSMLLCFAVIRVGYNTYSSASLGSIAVSVNITSRCSISTIPPKKYIFFTYATKGFHARGPRWGTAGVPGYGYMTLYLTTYFRASKSNK